MAGELEVPLTNDREETTGDGGTSDENKNHDPKKSPCVLASHRRDEVQRYGRHCGWWCRNPLDESVVLRSSTSCDSRRMDRSQRRTAWSLGRSRHGTVTGAPSRSHVALFFTRDSPGSAAAARENAAIFPELFFDHPSSRRRSIYPTVRKRNPHGSIGILLLPRPKASYYSTL